VQIEKRLRHLRAGTAYVIQRTRRSGRVYEMRGQPMPEGGYVTTYTDITQFKSTEAELLDAKQTLERRVVERTQELSKALDAEAMAKQSAELANATKTRFVAAASHDLLQPLNAARLFASALQESSQDSGVRDIATHIEGSMRAAEEVLDDMLDIARLESGAMRANPVNFPLDAVLAEVERQFAPVAAQRNLRLHVRRTRALVHSDRVLVRRLLQNLISNALRYTQRGGVVVACRRRQGRCVVQVWDTGPGIAEQHRKVIFKRVPRARPRVALGREGTRPRLSICDRIARLLEIELTLQSRVGQGSVFAASLPVASRAGSASR
jgi:signal transduction histidine kinase